MTISTPPSPLSYNGDGATVAFSITFKYFTKSDVVATLRSSAGVETTWVENTHYTLSAANVDAGGTLTATTAPASGETLVIELEPPNTQTSSLPVGGSFPSTTVEDELDQTAQRDAKLQTLLDRALLVPKTDTQTGSLLDLPIDSSRASNFLSFDANGAPVVAAGTSANLGPVSAYIDTLLDDADSATARTTLGIETSETATGAFTINPDILTTYLDSSAAAVTGTLGARTVPGFKLMVMSDATNTSTVSVTNAVTGTPELYTFTALDAPLLLMWTGRVWMTIIG